MISPQLPPVIVVGIDSPIGLAVVRELGGAGIDVHGIARTKRGVGLYSRYLARGYVCAEGGEALIDQLLSIAASSGASLVMTVSMGDALSVRAAADAGRLPGLRPLLPSANRLALVNDKAAICDLAEGLQIPVPRTWQPQDVDGPLPPSLFPCVLKWRDPELAAKPLAQFGLPMLKSEFVYDEISLRAALARYRPMGVYPMVQSFCPGSGLGQMFLMKDGRAVMSFQHRRLHEWPPEGGISTLCESLPPDENAELMAKSEELLRQIGWEGPAMVEYRHDPETGKVALMEINGRFWGSLPLASAAGARFALATYFAIGLGEEPPTSSYRAGLRCRFLVPETRRLLRVTFGRAAIPDRSLKLSAIRELVDYLSGFISSRHYVFCHSDPQPFVADMLFMGRELVRSILTRLFRRRVDPGHKAELLKL
jgi:predicted ATP-grasp superfamily ATP-dependent carboligase